MKKTHDYSYHYRGYWSEGGGGSGSTERTDKLPWWSAPSFRRMTTAEPLNRQCCKCTSIENPVFNTPPMSNLITDLQLCFQLN